MVPHNFRQLSLLVANKPHPTKFVHQPFKIIIASHFKTAFLLQQMLRLA